jgi:dipeptidyl aminopeptidase/acylaminoacyl peptidase
MGRTALLALVITMLLAAPAGASFPGANGLIAFARQGERADSPFFIYTMNSSGKEKTRLTTDGSSRNPAWSSDGERIAFDRAPAEGSRKRRLWLMNADGSGQRRVPIGSFQAHNPSWSPDGRRLVFQGCGRRTKCKRDSIFVTGVNGRGRRKIAGDGIDPVWSPDGRWIAYGGRLERDGCPTLVLVRPSGKRRHAIVPPRKDAQKQCTGAAGIDFSPDSRRLVYFAIEGRKVGTYENPVTHKKEPRYAYNHAMYTVDADGTHRRQIASRSIEASGFYFLPFVWSPDGDELLWRDDRGSYIGRPGGSKRRIAGQFGGGIDYAWQPLPH